MENIVGKPVLDDEQKSDATAGDLASVEMAREAGQTAYQSLLLEPTASLADDAVEDPLTRDVAIRGYN